MALGYGFILGHIGFLLFISSRIYVVRRNRKTPVKDPMEIVRKQQDKIPISKEMKILSDRDYLSERDVLSSLLNAESQLCFQLFQFVGGLPPEKKELETAFEVFVTWKLKLKLLRTPLVCNRAFKLELKLEANNKVSVKGELQLSPEDNFMQTYDGKMEGLFTVGSHSLGFDDYTVSIKTKGTRYTLRPDKPVSR